MFGHCYIYFQCKMGQIEYVSFGKYYSISGRSSIKIELIQAECIQYVAVIKKLTKKGIHNQSKIIIF